VSAKVPARQSGGVTAAVDAVAFVVVLCVGLAVAAPAVPGVLRDASFGETVTVFVVVLPQAAIETAAVSAIAAIVIRTKVILISVVFGRSNRRSFLWLFACQYHERTDDRRTRQRAPLDRAPPLRARGGHQSHA
jgi:hypothetical protein